MQADLSFFLSSFITLFVIFDALGTAPIFTSLMQGKSHEEYSASARKAVYIAGCILFFFAFFGRWFLSALGIGIDAFQIAGGILLFITAVEMLFDTRTKRRSGHARDAMNKKGETAHMPDAAPAPQDGYAQEEEEEHDPAIFPIAIPMVAGPGSIASVLLLTSSSKTLIDHALIATALILNLVIVYIFLRFSRTLMTLAGRSIEQTLGRLLAVILAAIGTEFVVEGIQNLVNAPV